jgi:hypothetical protein
VFCLRFLIFKYKWKKYDDIFILYDAEYDETLKLTKIQLFIGS